MVCNVITADRANRLFWLGRYAERVYISLHLLRRYYDMVLDGDTKDLHEYYECLGIGGDTTREFQLSQLYDLNNICSIATSLSLAGDNAIVLRHDITSESMSYIQMSQALLEECSLLKEKNITRLQPVTDYMLAFFGSIDERVFDNRIRKFLKIGKLVENIDLHIRFNYPFFRIEEAYLKLKEYIAKIDFVADDKTIAKLDDLLTEDKYADQTAGYKECVLGFISSLVLV
ncbi:MAG: alpha-E domain-containing protein [Rikenellaceae bacterium]